MNTPAGQGGRRRRVSGVLVAVAIVGVLAAAWLRWGVPGDTPAPGPAAQPAPTAAAPAPTNDTEDDEEDPVAAAPPRRADLPDPSRPLAETIPELLELAKQGRADAMHALSMHLMRCRRVMDVGDTEMRTEEVKRFYWRYGREPSTDRELDRIAASIERGATLREACAGVDEALADDGVAWLEKAALAGDTDAMLDYSQWGLSGMRDANTLMQNFDEVARRRELAGTFLKRALERGDCRALGALASAYAADGRGRQWIFTADPYFAVVYAEAQRLADQRSGGLTAEQERRRLGMIERRGEGLEAARLDAARRQGAQLFQARCAG